MSLVVTEYEGSRNSGPLEGPLQTILQLQTPIKAWHKNYVELQIHETSSYVGGTRRQAESTVGAVWVICGGAFVFGGPILCATAVAVTGYVLAKRTAFFQMLVGQEREFELDYDRYKERYHILSNLDHIDHSIDIEVHPLAGQRGSVKTYAFASGHFAHAWVSVHEVQFCKNPLVVFVKDEEGRIREMASLPALQNDHSGYPLEEIPTQSSNFSD